MQIFTNEMLCYKYASHLKEQLEGKHLIIGTLQNYPMSYAVKINDTWVGKGVAFNFIKYLQRKLHFTYSVVLPEENSLGSQTEGMMGLLYNNKVDLAAAFLPRLVFASSGVPCSPVLDDGHWVVLMRRPKESATGAGLLAPFDWDVWLLVFISLLVVGPIMHYIISFRGKLIEDDSDLSTLSMENCSWFVYGALMKQGSVIDPKSDTTRILFATWWIFITILTSFYTANLTAFLTLSHFTLPINSLKDIGVKHYNWVANRGNLVQKIAEDRSDPFHAALRGSKGYYVDYAKVDILEKYIFRQNFVFLAQKLLAEHMMYNDYQEKVKNGIAEENRCRFVMTSWTATKTLLAFAYSRNFTYAGLFSSELASLVEAGIIKQKLKAGLPGTEICPLNLGSKERQLRNTDLLLTYYLVAGGYIIALVIFICENFCRSPSQRSREGHRTETTKLERIPSPKFQLPPPPPYHTLFGVSFRQEGRRAINFNGRDYWVVKGKTGRDMLVPIRAPSAVLFHYTYYN